MMFFWCSEDEPSNVVSFMVQHEVEAAHDEMIDEMYAEEEARITDVTFAPSRILKIDDAAWKKSFGQYVEQYTSCDVPWELYADGITDGTGDAHVRDFIVANPQRWMVGE